VIRAPSRTESRKPAVPVCSTREQGRYHHRQGVIFLRADLLRVEQRAVPFRSTNLSTHDVATRAVALAWYNDRQEASVDREAARWALPLGALAEALRGDPSAAEAADRLKTTEALLRIRLDALHPAELAHLRRCAAAREEAV